MLVLRMLGSRSMLVLRMLGSRSMLVLRMLALPMRALPMPVRLLRSRASSPMGARWQSALGRATR